MACQGKGKNNQLVFASTSGTKEKVLQSRHQVAFSSSTLAMKEFSSFINSIIAFYNIALGEERKLKYSQPKNVTLRRVLK